MKKFLSFLLAAVLTLSVFTAMASAYTGSSERQLINSSALTPVKTGYTPLDKLVSDYFSANFTKGMDSFDKLKKCYDFLVYNSNYGNSTKTYSTYLAIDAECNYYSLFDRRLVAEAYCFIRSKIGSCNDFAGAFMVMARALGFECYVIDGYISWSAGTNEHTWCLIKLGNAYYCFDPQAEWRNYCANGSISYSNFCIAEGLQHSRSYNRSECISKFNYFKCRNKNNNPGLTIPGTEVSADPVYSKGVYITNEKMNFRADHNIFSTIYCVIPANTKVKVTSVYSVWGKIKYNGQTGWISLDYSTLADNSKDDEESTPATGQATPPKVETHDNTKNEVFVSGTYRTNEYMNFRTAVDGNIICVIPSGTELKITSVKNQWGKTEYNGTEGWLSLEYSKLIKNFTAGDVNGDNEVTTADARLILRHAVSLESIKSEFIKNADLNGDGKVTSADARLVLRLATEWD